MRVYRCACVSHCGTRGNMDRFRFSNKKRLPNSNGKSHGPSGSQRKFAKFLFTSALLTHPLAPATARIRVGIARALIRNESLISALNRFVLYHPTPRI